LYLPVNSSKAALADTLDVSETVSGVDSGSALGAALSEVDGGGVFLASEVSELEQPQHIDAANKTAPNLFISFSLS